MGCEERSDQAGLGSSSCSERSVEQCSLCSRNVAQRAALHRAHRAAPSHNRIHCSADRVLLSKKPASQLQVINPEEEVEGLHLIDPHQLTTI